MGNDYVGKSAIGAGAAAAVPKAAVAITVPAVRVRRNIASLSNAEVRQLADAMKALNSSSNTLYADLVRTHNANRGEVHSKPNELKPLFLPWHRAFLIRFEQLVGDQLDDPTFGLPYWDWTGDASTGRSAALWTDGRYGGWGTVADGPFSGTQWPITTIPGVQSATTLTRAPATDARAVKTQSDVMSVMRSVNFPIFCGRLERELHNYMHGWVGGSGGQMSSVPVSVNEPAFWLHHCNVDRIWAQWQEFFPEQKTEATGMTGDTLMPATLTRQGFDPGAVTVGSVVDAPGRVYRYDKFYQPDIIWGADAQWPSSTANYSSSGTPALALYRQKLYCLRQQPGDAGWMRGSWYDGTSWQGGDGLVYDENNNMIGLSGTPAMAAYHDRLYLTHEARGDRGWVWQSVNHGSSWAKDARIPSDGNTYGTSGTPALAVYQDKLHCLRQGRGNSGWLLHGINSGPGWSDEAPLYDANNQAIGISGWPALAVFGGLLHCVRLGRGSPHDRQVLWWSTYNGSTWSADQRLPSDNSPYRSGSPPALVAYAGKLYCVYEGAIDIENENSDLPDFHGGSGYLYVTSYDGRAWSDPAPVSYNGSGIGTSGTVALAVYGGKLYCIREDRGNVGRLRCVTVTFDAPAPTTATVLPDGNMTKPMLDPNAGRPAGKGGRVSTS